MAERAPDEHGDPWECPVCGDGTAIIEALNTVNGDELGVLLCWGCGTMFVKHFALAPRKEGP